MEFSGFNLLTRLSLHTHTGGGPLRHRAAQAHVRAQHAGVHLHRECSLHPPRRRPLQRAFVWACGVFVRVRARVDESWMAPSLHSTSLTHHTSKNNKHNYNRRRGSAPRCSRSCCSTLTPSPRRAPSRRWPARTWTWWWRCCRSGDSGSILRMCRGAYV